MENKNIELITVYEIMGQFAPATYTTPQTIAKVKQGRKFVYLIPYGEDYECEGGHHIEIIGQEEFERKYSLKITNIRGETR
jgi:hypothetical protein